MRALACNLHKNTTCGELPIMMPNMTSFAMLDDGGAMDLCFLKRVFFMAALSVFFVVSGCEKQGEAFRLAPDFSLKNLSGDPVSLSRLKGKIVLVDFWATWCPPCRKSIPELVDLQKKYRDKGLIILGISMDHPEKTSDNSLMAFKERYRINYNILRGDGRVAMDYFRGDEMPIPTMFVINREGNIVAKHVGYRPGALEKSLKELLS